MAAAPRLPQQVHPQPWPHHSICQAGCQQAALGKHTQLLARRCAQACIDCGRPRVKGTRQHTPPAWVHACQVRGEVAAVHKRTCCQQDICHGCDAAAVGQAAAAEVLSKYRLGVLQLHPVRLLPREAREARCAVTQPKPSCSSRADTAAAGTRCCVCESNNTLQQQQHKQQTAGWGWVSF